MTANVPREWHTVIQVDPNAPPPGPQPVLYRSSRIETGPAAFTDSPDVPTTTASNTTQSENSVFVSPLNPAVLLNSNNSSDWPVTQIFGSSYWISTNGGLTWTGSIAGAGGTNRGDPTTAINRNGRMFVGYIALDYGQGVAYSDNSGASWTQRTIAPGPYILDKEHMWVDDNASSPFANNMYAAWTNFQGGVADGEIEFMRSTDGGLNWTNRQTISSAILAGSHNQGVNVQTAPNGDVYVVWAVYDAFPADENALGFAKSTNGGQTFSAAQRILTGIRGHRNTALGGGKTMRHNSFPSMAVNQQTGEIFVVWTNIGVPGVNTGDPDVYLISSSNGGTSWSSPRRVNQDPQGNGKDNYFPWIACDPVTGLLACVSYDSRNFAANDMVETFVATSTDNGVTWQDFRVSDVAWSGDGIVGFSGNYAGDYLAIAARDNNVYPMWSDNRSGNTLTYVSPFTVGPPPPPVANFSGSPTSGPGPLTVQFTDLSTNGPTSWLWDFGDGGSSTVQNPSHTYTNVGSYSVSLTATNAAGSDNETKLNYITVTAPAPNIHVQSISVSRVGLPGAQWRADARVTIVDETGAPVSAATVSGVFNAPNSRTRTGTTDATGVAVVSSAKTKTPPADWCFTVTDVAKTGEVYDPGQNVVTAGCESGAAPARAAATEGGDMGFAARGLESSKPADIVTSGGAQIEFSLEVASHLRVEVFDLGGRRMAVLADEDVPAGNHRYTWNGRGVPNGVYLYRVQAAGLLKTGKVLVVGR
ncbi:MAG TPA: PKD domain-containing protein [Candidatus Eisenbacteria bacterium]